MGSPSGPLFDMISQVVAHGEKTKVVLQTAQQRLVDLSVVSGIFVCMRVLLNLHAFILLCVYLVSIVSTGNETR
jgi:hypothetical protein